MKTPVAAVLATAIFVTVAVAVDTSFKTRLITSSTLTIQVKDGQFVTIRNFTQDKDVGQRGVIVAGVVPSTPTPSPTPAPTPTPTAAATPTSTDLTATKTNSVGGNVTFPNPWTWNIHVANGGGSPATFSFGQNILTDNLPNFNITYNSNSVSVTNPVNITNSNAINCAITGSDLSCLATDVVTIGAGGSFDVSFTATPSVAGSYTNPRSGGGCSVDPSNVVSESNENNNTCADTVISNTPNPTPTPIFATVFTASLMNPPPHPPLTRTPAEFIKPIVIAGPATLTIEPVPGATLSITYRKSLQPIQPTPTP